MKFTYLMQPPRRYTFEQPKVKQWVESIVYGRVLNLFAGKTLLDCDEIRVDIDKNMPADYHMEAYEFISIINVLKFDCIILDPPYNLRKSREKYGGRYIGSFTKIKNKVISFLKGGGLIITFGYDTVGMGKGRGFNKEHILVICHSGDHNDTLAVVERYNQEGLFVNQIT